MRHRHSGQGPSALTHAHAREAVDGICKGFARRVKSRVRETDAVGRLTSGGFGYTVGTNIELGYVRSAGGVTGAYPPLATTGSRSRARGCDPAGVRVRG